MTPQSPAEAATATRTPRIGDAGLVASSVGIAAVAMSNKPPEASIRFSPGRLKSNVVALCQRVPAASRLSDKPRMYDEPQDSFGSRRLRIAPFWLARPEKNKNGEYTEVGSIFVVLYE